MLKFRPVREISQVELEQWRVQFAREGTLPPEAIRRLLEHIADEPIVVPA